MRNTPNVLSSIFVLKYQLQAHVDILLERSNEISTLIKWADVWEIPCFEVSNAHIFHALLGYYWYRLYINTLKDKAANTTCMIIPANPKI